LAISISYLVISILHSAIGILHFAILILHLALAPAFYGRLVCHANCKLLIAEYQILKANGTER